MNAVSDAKQPPPLGNHSKDKKEVSSGSGMEGRQGGGNVAVCCFLGIFISYFIYGLLQEKM